MKKIISNILKILSKSKIIFILSKKIIDYRRNENNCNTEDNGELYFIKKNKEKFSVIFDVGANIGEWTKVSSKIIPTAEIYSFEPSKETFKKLSEQKFNKNIKLYNIALGEKNEIKDFYYSEKDSTLSSALSRNIPSTIESVVFETIDSFCKKNNIEKISFLKIDVEGNELAVLKGAEQYIQEGKIDNIQFEYGGTYIDANIMLKNIFNFFENKPYTINKLLPKGLLEYKTYNQDLENYQYSNYIAILNKIC